MRMLNSGTLALTILLAVTSGLGFMMFGVWMRILNTTHGYSLELLSAATSGILIVSGLVGMGVGRLMRRYDARLFIAAGAVTGCAALSVIGNAAELWMVFAGYFLFAVAFACNGVLFASILIARWFRDQSSRGSRLAIATTGLSVGGIVLSPIAARLLETYGMPMVMPYLGLCYLLGSAVAIALLRPIIARPRHASDVLGTDSRLQRGEYPVFWMASIGIMLLLGCNVGALQHIYNFTAHNLSSGEIAALAVSAFSAGSFFARFLGGMALRWTSLANYTTAVAALQISTMVLLTQVSHPWLYLAIAFGFGGTVSTTLMLQSLLVSHLYASHRYPALFSKLAFIAALGMGLYPLITGILASRYSYDFAFQILAMLSLAGLVILLLAIRTRGPATA